MGISARTATVPLNRIVQSILTLRGHRVILDSELAALYGVSTKRVNEQIRRNQERFPTDFMFQLTAEELARSQIQAVSQFCVTLKSVHPEGEPDALYRGRPPAEPASTGVH